LIDKANYTNAQCEEYKIQLDIVGYQGWKMA